MCFHNRKFAYKHSLSPKKKKKVWLTENSIQGRTESELTAPWTQNSPQDLSASRASHGVSQRSQPQIQTRLLEKHIPGPTHRCQVHPMIIAMDFGEPRGRRWKEIGSTLPTVGRGSAKATLNLPVSAILLCSCTILMQILSIVFQGLTEILSLLAENPVFLANMIMASHCVALCPKGLQIVLQTRADTWPMYTVTSSSTTEMCSASRTTCHKWLAKHRSSLQYFRLGRDECLMLLNPNKKVEPNYVSRNSVAHTLIHTPSALHLLLNSYYSAF